MQSGDTIQGSGDQTYQKWQHYRNGIADGIVQELIDEDDVFLQLQKARQLHGKKVEVPVIFKGTLLIGTNSLCYEGSDSGSHGILKGM